MQKVRFNNENYGAIVCTTKGDSMKRETVEIIVETPTTFGDPEGQRFLIPSGFDHLMIEVWETPTELEVKHVAKIGEYNLGKPKDAELLELDEMVDAFAERMKRELHVGFHKGKRSWKDETFREHFMRRLIVHAAEGRMIKAASYAAVIWWMAKVKRGTARGS